jgi:hypothetical protein
MKIDAEWIRLLSRSQCNRGRANEFAATNTRNPPAGIGRLGVSLGFVHATV